MEPTEELVAVADGVRLNVRRWVGAPDREPPFLLVHGLSSNARLWDGVARRLVAIGFSALAVDLRSHGESDRPPDGYDTATAAADLSAICAALDLPPVFAVGQSWGGNVVVALAAAQPSRVRALGLVDGGWIDLSARFSSWAACEQALRPPELDGMTANTLRAYLRGNHRDWADWAIDATVANLRVNGSGRLERRLPVPQHMSILRSMWDDPPSRHFPAITAPALLLPAGASSPQARRAAAAMHDATVKAYRGADHDLHAQHPDELARDLVDFLEVDFLERAP
jgi:pimeloyl-ACP methyl ester carboxylesterase